MRFTCNWLTALSFNTATRYRRSRTMNDPLDRGRPVRCRFGDNRRMIWLRRPGPGHRPALRILLLACALATIAARARAQSGEHVLLVINTRSSASDQIGTHYARARAIPQDNILRIATDPAEQINRAQFDREIKGPIGRWLNRHAAQDRILYIVLTKDVPLRVAGAQGRTGTVASVDSELTLLYRNLTGRAVAPQASLRNPYFLGDRPIADAKPFSHEEFDIFLVARLDGFSVADVLAMIDRGTAPSRAGRIILDEKFSLASETGNRWLERAAEVLQTLGSGDRVLLDSTARVVANESNVLGYYSWGSNDPAFKGRRLGLGFLPGALAATFVSTDGRTFKEPPASWTIGRWEDARSYFAGSPQSLAGDLIREGVTGVAAHVAEPYLDATIRPDILFPAYLSGFNLVESFYLAMPYLSWQTVVIGDPLCAPFRQRTLTPQDIDRGVDRSTEYPMFFSTRTLQVLAKNGTVSEPMRLLVRAQARLARDDRAGATQALEQATALDDRLVDAHLMVASLSEGSGDIDKAIERYRRVLALAPNHVVALNNLAYALAVHRRDGIREALPLARRAQALARNVPTIADTLAWILHLAGDDREARPFAAAAVRGAPDNAQVRLHSAVINAGVGAADLAARDLQRALELDPKLEEDPEVQALRATLGRSGKP